MTTPFYSGTVGYAGQDPGDPIYWPDDSAEFWVGQPGQMIQLPAPMIDGYQRDVSFSETVHGHPGGGQSVTEFDPVSQWTIPFQRLMGRDFQLVQAMRRGVGPFATAPWCYLPPEDTNRLTLAQSLCGGLNGVAEGWAPSVGTVTYDPTVTAADMMSGVLRWTGAGNTSVLVAGGYVGGTRADTTYGCPYLPSRPWSGFAYAATASGTASVQARVVGLAADGRTIVQSINGTATTVGTAPTRLSLSINPDDLAASAYIVFSLRCLTATAPDLLVSCPLLVDNYLPDTWSAGAGVPRVIWPVSPSRAIGWHRGSDLTVTLAECYSGAS